MTPTAPTPPEAAALLGGDAEAPHSLALEFAGYRVDVRTNSAPLRQALADYFRGFEAGGGPAMDTITALEAASPRVPWELTLKEREPGKTKIKEEYLELAGGRLVRKRLTGMVFVFGQGVHLAVGPCEANDNQVINFVNNRHIQWMLDRGGLLLHAAGVASGGRGLTLSGRSGMGKSTLALHLMSRGLDLVSNDRVVARATGGGLEMNGVAKMPRINPGTALNNPDLAGILGEAERAEFGALPQAELWRLEHKYDVMVDQAFGPGRFRLGAEMRGLVVLDWARGGGRAEPRRVSLAQRRGLMPAFMKSPGAFYLEGRGLAHDEADYLRVLGEAPVLEIGGGVDFEAACDACQAFLEA